MRVNKIEIVAAVLGAPMNKPFRIKSVVSGELLTEWYLLTESGLFYAEHRHVPKDGVLSSLILGFLEVVS